MLSRKMKKSTRTKTMKTIKLLFWMAVTAISVSPATAKQSCDTWNTAAFFLQASVEDIERCLQGIVDVGPVADVTTIMLLEAGVDPNARDEHEFAPLHYAAAFSDDPDAITVLVEAGADVNAREADGWSPLHIAAGLTDNPDVITRLVELGADLEARDDDGWTPLHFAGNFNKNHDIFTRLIDLGADGRAKTGDGETVWELAGWKMAMQVDMTMTYDPVKEPWEIVLSGPEISAIIDGFVYDRCSDENKLDEYIDEYIVLFDPGCDENNNDENSSITFVPLDLLVPEDLSVVPMDDPICPVC